MLLVLCLFCLLVDILTIVCLVRQQRRILFLESTLASRTRKAELFAHVAWFFMHAILRGLAAGYPADQWLKGMDEITHGELEYQVGGTGLGRDETPGTGACRAEAGEAEGNNE